MSGGSKQAHSLCSQPVFTPLTVPRAGSTAPLHHCKLAPDSLHAHPMSAPPVAALNLPSRPRAAPHLARAADSLVPASQVDGVVSSMYASSDNGYFPNQLEAAGEQGGAGWVAGTAGCSGG